MLHNAIRHGVTSQDSEGLRATLVMARPGPGLSPGERGARYSAAPGHSGRDGRQKKSVVHIHNAKCTCHASEESELRESAE